MITIKSDAAISQMKKACEITCGAMKAAIEAIRPGVTTEHIDKVVHEYILSRGAIPSFLNYGGFPKSVCISVNDTVIHGIPDSTIIRDGDIVSIDVGAKFAGFHGDMARTIPVGNVAPETLKLIEVTRQSFFEGLKYCREGYRVSDISHAIGEYASGYGYGIVEEFTGHGIGRDLHEDPAVLNFGQPGRGVRLRAGMTLAIEPMINAGTKDVSVLEDEWTVKTDDGKPSAHYENTVLITDGDPVILTGPLE